MSETIVDLHVDAGAFAFREFPVTSAAEVAADLECLGVTRAVVGSAAAITYVSPQPANERLAQELVALGREWLVPAAVLDPAYPGAMADLRACRELGFGALKLYPTYHDFDPLSYETVELMEAAASYGWPTLLCVRVEDERHHHPLMQVAPLPVTSAVALARNVPSASLVLCGGTVAEVVSFLQGTDRDSALAEVSWIKGPLNAIEDTVAKVGGERLVFGSHAPFSYPQTALAKVREAFISDDDKARILHGIASRVLPPAK